MSDQPQTAPQPLALGLGERVTTGLALLIVGFFILSPSTFPLGKLDAVAYAVCHRLPEHSFFIGGQQLPLCARCTGTFLGVLLTLTTLTLAGRSRASRMPPARVLAMLMGFVLLWGLDGLNSYLSLYPGAPHLYAPQNWLRLTTGMLNGLTMGTLVFAILNFSLWRAPRPVQVLRGLGELVGLMLLAGLVIGLVLSGLDDLLYPVALFSTLGVLAMLTSANTVIVLIATRRENVAYHWHDAAWPVLVALALSLVIIMGIGAGRSALTDALDLPL